MEELTFTKLAREEINILQIAPASNGLFIVFEYSWFDAKGNKHWAKASQAWTSKEPKWNINQDILDLVEAVRSEINQ